MTVPGLGWFRGRYGPPARRGASAPAVLGLVLMAAGCSGASGEVADRRSLETKERTVVVRVAPATLEDLSLDIEVAGSLSPAREVILAAEVPGKVLRTSLDLGRRVAKGDVLVVLSTAGLAATSEATRATLTAAEARLGEAMRNLESGRRLFTKKVISVKELDSLELAVSLATADVRGIKANIRRIGADLGGARVKAPFDGIIASKNVEIGAVVAPGAPLGRLVEIDTLKVTIGVSESEVVRIEEGLTAKVTIDVLADREFEGRVDAIAPVPDPGTRTYAVEIRVENPEAVLRAGWMARVTIPGEIRRGLVLVPREALLLREEEDVVFTVDEVGDREETTAKKVEVTLTGRYGARVALTGIEAGMLVVTAGQTRIKDGDTVILGFVEGREAGEPAADDDTASPESAPTAASATPAAAGGGGGPAGGTGR